MNKISYGLITLLLFSSIINSCTPLSYKRYGNWKQFKSKAPVISIIPFSGSKTDIVNGALDQKYTKSGNILSPSETFDILESNKWLEFIETMKVNDDRMDDYTIQEYLISVPQEQRKRISSVLHKTNMLVVPYCHWEKVELIENWLCKECNLSIVVKIQVFDLSEGTLIYSDRYETSAKEIEEDQLVDFRHNKSIPYEDMIIDLFDYLFEQMWWNLSLE